MRVRPAGGSPGCDDGRVHVPPIRTARFELVSMSMRFMRFLLARDLDAASAEIGVQVPDDLPDELDNFLQFRIADLELDASAAPWLGRAIVRTEPDGTKRFIGTAGFHSPPDADGRVEVGYRVEPQHRRQGVASEVVRGLFDWAAREHGIRRFRAAVSPDNVASLAVISRLGFRQTGLQIDDIDGEELVFELDDWNATS
jgi:[ribosomal protein S5]-alanine N-acetyltransferase